MTQKYVNFSHLIDWLKSLSLNRDVNKDPYMDNALLNMRQILKQENGLTNEKKRLPHLKKCFWDMMLERWKEAVDGETGRR